MRFFGGDRFVTPFSTIYNINQWTTPRVKDTKLFAFTTLKEAQKFAYTSPSLRIFECEVKNPRKNPTIVMYFSAVYEYWKLRKQKRNVSHISKRFDYGNGGICISCDAIKLLKEVK
jgi:hypothetical protein